MSVFFVFKKGKKKLRKHFYETLLKYKRNFDYWYHHKKIEELIKNGLRIGKNVTIMPTAEIDDSYPYLISIGDNSSISKYVQLIAHDQATFKFSEENFERLGKIEIKENCYIGQSAIILPGVTIGPNVLVAAGSVVNKDIPPNSCVVGVPARIYSKFDEFIKRQLQNARSGPNFSSNETMHPVSKSIIEKIRPLVEEGDVFIRGFQGGPMETFPYIVKEKLIKKAKSAVD